MNRSHFLKAALLTPFAAVAASCVAQVEAAPDMTPPKRPCSDDEGDCETVFMAVENAVGHNVLYLSLDSNVKWVATASLGGIPVRPAF